MSALTWRTSKHVLLGVLWRTGVFIIAVLCFNWMVGLRDWEKRFAASEAWGKMVAEEKTNEWAPVIQVVAKDLAGDAEYTTKAAFLASIKSRLREKPKLWGSKVEPRVETYANAVTRRDVLMDRQRARATKFEADFAATTEGFTKLDDDLATLERLEKDCDAQGKALNALKEAKGDKDEIARRTEALIALENQRDDLRSALADPGAQRGKIAEKLEAINKERTRIDGIFNSQIAAANATIKAAEDGIETAFEPVAKYARRVDRYFRGLPHEKILRIGTEGEPLYIVYLAVWFGLESLVVLLACIVIVPWFLALATSDTDADSVKSNVTQKLKEWFTLVFRKAPPAALGKVLLAATVGTAGIAGINAAADAPNVLPAVTHERPSEGPRPVAPPDRSLPDDQQEVITIADPPAAERYVTPEELAVVIAAVNGALSDIDKKVGETKGSTDALVKQAETMNRNMGSLSSGFHNTVLTLGHVNGSISDLTKTNHSILLGNAAAAKHLDASLNRMQVATAAAAAGIGTVSKQVDDAAAAEKAADAEIITTSALGDGFLRPLNPFYRYQVTPEAKATVERAMIDPKTPEAQKILAVLEDMTKKDSMKIWTFEQTLRNNVASGRKHDQLEQLMPLILKVSRVRGDA